MTKKKTISGRVPPGLEKQFEDFCEEKGMSKSDGLRLLLAQALEQEQQAGSESESNSSGGQGTLFSRFIPAAIASFLAAALILFAMGESTQATSAIAFASIGGLFSQRSLFDTLPDVLSDSDSPEDARKGFLYGYSALTASGVLFSLLNFSGLTLAAGLIEIAAFVVAWVLLLKHVDADTISAFAAGRAVELVLLAGGSAAVISFVLFGTPRIFAEVGAISVVLGWLSIGFTTARFWLDVLSDNDRTLPDAEVSV